jgi:hypothetical protein
MMPEEKKILKNYTNIFRHANLKNIIKEKL